MPRLGWIHRCHTSLNINSSSFLSMCKNIRSAPLPGFHPPLPGGGSSFYLLLPQKHAFMFLGEAGGGGPKYSSPKNVLFFGEAVAG
jgi:hypothetical protein